MSAPLRFHANINRAVRVEDDGLRVVHEGNGHIQHIVLCSSRPLQEGEVMTIACTGRGGRNHKTEYKSVGLTTADPGQGDDVLRRPHTSCSTWTLHSRHGQIYHGKRYMWPCKQMKKHYSSYNTLGISWSGSGVHLHANGSLVCTYTRLEKGPEKTCFDTEESPEAPMWAVFCLSKVSSVNLINPFPAGCELNAACARGDAEEAGKLIREGASITELDYYKGNPVDWLINSLAASSFDIMAKLIIRNGVFFHRTGAEILRDSLQFEEPDFRDKVFYLGCRFHPYYFEKFAHHYPGDCFISLCMCRAGVRLGDRIQLALKDIAYRRDHKILAEAPGTLRSLTAIVNICPPNSPPSMDTLPESWRHLLTTVPALKSRAINCIRTRLLTVQPPRSSIFTQIYRLTGMLPPKLLADLGLDHLFGGEYTEDNFSVCYKYLREGTIMYF